MLKKKMLMLAVCLLFGVTAITAGSPMRVSMDGNVQAFISVNDDATISTLKSMGVQVTSRYDGFVTALIPSGSMTAVRALDGVSTVSQAITLTTSCDSARYYSHVDEVHQGTGLSSAYTGNGVVIGVIDCGFDFNHINFADASGASRVRAVYMPYDNKGNAPVIDGYTLPGSCYEDAAQIAALTTDDAEATHGTQTAGIAAGSYDGNGWQGVATGADIVMCGMPEGKLTDYHVANCINYIFDYAQRVGKPCVINISLESNQGTHDGRSYLVRAMDQLSGPGRICVVSAGNDGGAKVCYHGTLTGSNDVATTLLGGYLGGMSMAGDVSVWSDAGETFKTRMVIMNTSTGEVLYKSAYVNDGESCTWNSADDKTLSGYMSGSMTLTSEISYDQRQHTLLSVDATMQSSTCVPGLQYVSDAGASVTAWGTQYVFFYDYGVDGVGSASASGSINDLATGDSIISVGAYCTRQTVPLRDGSSYWRERSKPTEIAYFSAYGPDERGISRPDLCAPGSMVVSSANRYDTDAPNIAYWQPSAVVNGEEYPYCPDLGTSMSAPWVTGTIALLMQCDPNLGANAVREIFKNSCSKESGDRWGMGKLDVLAALQYAETGYLHGDVNNDGEVTIADVNAIVDIILNGGYLEAADVNADGEVTIADVNAVIDIILS